MLSITDLMIIVFLINLPFGYYRSKVKKYSKEWMMAIHVPVPFVILLRILSGFSLSVIPFLLLSDIAGQFLGGKIRKIKAHA